MAVTRGVQVVGEDPTAIPRPAASRPGNRILASLPPGERAGLIAEMDPVSFAAGERVLEPGQSMGRVYFPLSGVVSLVTRLPGGAGVEVAMIGREGMVGVPVILGGRSWPNIGVVQQIAGVSLALDAERFREVLDRSSSLRARTDSYVRALLSQAAQEVACNRLHPIEQRTARWLLITHDRVASDIFSLTQEFLAEALGVRRPSISGAEAELARAGAIEYHRGQVRIADRAELERRACECYAVIRTEFDRLA